MVADALDRDKALAVLEEVQSKVGPRLKLLQRAARK